MINILYKMITILHEKMLNAIYLHWFHNDTLAELSFQRTIPMTILLNGHSNKPQTVKFFSLIFLVAVILILWVSQIIFLKNHQLQLWKNLKLQHSSFAENQLFQK